jgi:hypothetical protein
MAETTKKKPPRFSKTEIKAAVAAATDAGADVLLDYTKGQIRIHRPATGPGGHVSEITEQASNDDEALRIEHNMKTAFGSRK